MSINKVVVKLKLFVLPVISCVFATMAYFLAFVRSEINWARNLIDNLKVFVIEKEINSAESADLLMNLNDRINSIFSGLTLLHQTLVLFALFFMVCCLVRKGSILIKVITFFIVTWFTIFSSLFGTVT